MMLRAAVSRLRSAVTRRPLLANCVVYGSLYAGAEFSQQTLIRKIMVTRKLTSDTASV